MKRNISILLSGLFLGCLIVTLIIVHYGIGNAQNIQAVDKEIEKALLVEDWTKAATLLDSITTQTPFPVLRLLKGHATLALNRNNESLCLFLSVSSENDFKEWERWTSDFASRNSKEAVIRYLKGDALARLEKWDDALASFNKALELKPNHVLVLNARGVVYAAKGELGKAREDFDKAISSDKSFADAYTNLGARFIQMKDGAEGAIKAFNKAIEISPDFALALHGRGLVELVLNHMHEYKSDLENAEKNGTCGIRLMEENRIKVTAYSMGVEKEELLATLSGDPGTTLGKSFSDIDKVKTKMDNYIQHPTQFNYNRAFESYGGFGGLSPKQQDLLFSQFATKLNNDPKLKDVYEGHKSNFGTTNRQKIGELTMAVGGPLVGTKTVPGVITGLSMMGAGTKMKEWSDQNFKSYQSQIELGDKYLPNFNSPAGVDINFSNINWDKGEWPFVEYYSLLYGTNYREILSLNRKE